jgi:Icc-related predicted phosphoesterase
MRLSNEKIMKIAAITDIHNSFSNLARAIRNTNINKEIEVVINCGDIGRQTGDD